MILLRQSAMTFAHGWSASAAARLQRREDAFDLHGFFPMQVCIK
jgi:hypothetical protein